MRQRYLIALGSNRRHHRHGAPEKVLLAALADLRAQGMEIAAVSPVVRSAPLGPSLRRYANAAALIDCSLAPDVLLGALKACERRFGRRPGGQRWGSRVLDLDIVLWDAGPWSSPGLTIPHTAFRDRRFVLDPAAAIAGSWRDPLTGLTLRQLGRRRIRFESQPIRTSTSPHRQYGC